MAELDSILENYSSLGRDTKDKVLGVSFMVVTAKGEWRCSGRSVRHPVSTTILTHVGAVPRRPL